ncbi:MAG: hypothetical protein BECKG1743D_GA0114223_108423, partial [Candidatus Kentron sp. G]
GFKARGRRIVNYVTVIATQKLDDKDKQVGIFFDRNRLSYTPRFWPLVLILSRLSLVTIGLRYGREIFSQPLSQSAGCERNRAG